MVSRQKSSSHLARHVPCAVVVVSVFDVTCTSHSFLLVATSTFFEGAEPTTPRHERLFGRMAEMNTLTGYEPKDLIEVNDTEVSPMFFHRPSMTSTYDSAESIAAPPLESDLDDQQIRDTRVKNLTSDRVDISLVHRAVQGEDEALSRLSESENEAKLFLERAKEPIAVTDKS